MSKPFQAMIRGLTFRVLDDDDQHPLGVVECPETILSMIGEPGDPIVTSSGNFPSMRTTIIVTGGGLRYVYRKLHKLYGSGGPLSDHDEVVEEVFEKADGSFTEPEDSPERAILDDPEEEPEEDSSNEEVDKADGDGRNRHRNEAAIVDNFDPEGSAGEETGSSEADSGRGASVKEDATSSASEDGSREPGDEVGPA